MIVYGGDACYDKETGSRCGPETQTRCRHALDHIMQSHETDFIIGLMAGTPPRRPFIGPLRNLMLEFMTHELEGCGFVQRAPFIWASPAKTVEFILATEPVYGSFEETLTFDKLLDADHAHVIAVSTDQHMKRILTGWSLVSCRSVVPYSCKYPENPYTDEWMKTLETWLFAATYHWLGEAAYQRLSDLKNKYIDH